MGVREKLALQCDLKEERVEVWFKVWWYLYTICIPCTCPYNIIFKNRRAKERKKSRDGVIGTAIPPGGKSTRQSASGSDGRSNNEDRQSDASSSSEEIEDDDENEAEEANDKSTATQSKPRPRNQAKRKLEDRDLSPIDVKYQKVRRVWLA